MAAPASFGPEFRVSTTTLGNQDSSSIAALANGQFVAAWEDGGASGINAIRAQIYNGDGSKFRGELTVFAGSTDQVRPVVTGMADGRFAVAWEDHSGAAPNILARVSNSDGTSPSGAYQDAFLAAPGNPGDFFDKLPRTNPAIGAAAGGRSLVSWTLHNGDDDIYARAYNAAFAFSPDAITVDADFVNESQSAVAGLANGNYAVAWTDSGSVKAIGQLCDACHAQGSSFPG